jgi:hypothetical protein
MSQEIMGWPLTGTVLEGEVFGISGGEVTGVSPSAGAPDDADYLVGTANGGLSAEIVVGTTPGGELGGTWASPTVDASHSGSTHAAVQAAAEATAAAALSAHAGADVMKAAYDANTILKADSDDTPIALTVAEQTLVGRITAGVITALTATQVRTLLDVPTNAEAILDTFLAAKGDLISATANDTPSIVTVGADDTILMADAAAASGLKWAASATPSTQAIGDAAAVGTADTFTRGDHKHAMPAFATPAVVLDSAAAAGAAATLIRSDATIAAFDATVPTTQAFSDAAAVGTAAFAARRDHKHAMPALGTGATNACAGNDARLSDDRTNPGSARTSTAAIANTETVVISYTCAANEIAAGTTFRFTAFCSQAGTNAATPTIRIRVGTTTLIGNIAATVTGVVGGVAVPSHITGLVTCRTAGAGGTIIGSVSQLKHAAAGAQSNAVGTQTGTVAVDTTAANVLVELTFISGNAANTYTFQEAMVEKVV